MTITRRQIFENLTLARGRELATLFELDGLSSLSKSAFVDVLSRKRSLEPDKVLGALSRDELKSLCEALGLDSSGREKRWLIDRSLNHDAGTRAVAAIFAANERPATGTRANANTTIHEMESEIEIGAPFKSAKFRDGRGKLAGYSNDGLDRFPAGTDFLGRASANWYWVQPVRTSLNDAGTAPRGSGTAGTNKQEMVRQWFANNDRLGFSTFATQSFQ